jgi:drug/metabolite transporter (DMT)-like permease
VYLLAIAVAGVSTGLSTILFFSVPLLYFLLVTLLRERAGTRAKTDEIT